MSDICKEDACIENGPVDSLIGVAKIDGEWLTEFTEMGTERISAENNERSKYANERSRNWDPFKIDINQVLTVSKVTGEEKWNECEQRWSVTLNDVNMAED